jgi:glycosyltransferase involved in cell wall biosynthesis
LHPLGHFRTLPTARSRHFIERIGQEWAEAMPVGEPDTTVKGSVSALARQLQALMLLPGRQPAVPRHGRPTYLLASHHHLHKGPAIRAAQERLGASFVCFIHDLIPIEFPEYGRPGQDAKHRQRIDTAVRMADAFVVNSASTRDALLPYLHAAGRNVPLLVAPLGVRSIVPPGSPAAEPAADPYFVYVGTIEPRKNHLLLLHIWRHLVERMGAQAPRLVLIGQRGWENEMVVDILDRSVLLRGHVIEHNALPDMQVQALIAGSRALLLPSFAEGYGLPLAEALALGVPALCSDLPALREVGGEAPDYLDPIDGLGWMNAILDYIDPQSPRRTAQLRRIATWSAPQWPPHLEAVLRLIDALPAP